MPWRTSPPLSIPIAELFQSPHGALTKMRYMLRNRDVEEKPRECLRRDRYDAWIIHNTFPAMSPCVYGLALKQSVPVIHYLHNYRAGCLNGVFYRDGSPASPVKTATTFPASCTPAGAARSRPIPPWRPLRCINAPHGHLEPPFLLHRRQPPPAGAPHPNRNTGGQNQGHPPTSSGKNLPRRTSPARPPPPDLPRRDVLYAGRLLRRKKASSHWFRRGNALAPGRTLYLMGDGPLRGELSATSLPAALNPSA